MNRHKIYFQFQFHISYCMKFICWTARITSMKVFKYQVNNLNCLNSGETYCYCMGFNFFLPSRVISKVCVMPRGPEYCICYRMFKKKTSPWFCNFSVVKAVKCSYIKCSVKIGASNNPMHVCFKF